MACLRAKHKHHKWIRRSTKMSDLLFYLTRQTPINIKCQIWKEKQIIHVAHSTHTARRRQLNTNGTSRTNGTNTPDDLITHYLYMFVNFAFLCLFYLFSLYRYKPYKSALAENIQSPNTFRTHTTHTYSLQKWTSSRSRLVYSSTEKMWHERTSLKSPLWKAIECVKRVKRTTDLKSCNVRFGRVLCKFYLLSSIASISLFDWFHIHLHFNSYFISFWMFYMIHLNHGR